MSGHRAHVMCPGAQPQLAIIVPCARCAHRGATQRTLLHAHSECSLLAGEDGQRELGALERMAAITPSSTFDSFDIPNYARLNVPVTTQTSTHRRKQQATQTSLPATPIRELVAVLSFLSLLYPSIALVCKQSMHRCR
jgi:hypothetical protein